MAFVSIYDFNTDGNARVTMRWLEPYVTEGINKKLSVTTPEGIYRGWMLAPSLSALALTVNPDPVFNDHVAVVRTADGNAFTIRRENGAFDVDLSAVAGNTVVVAAYVMYAFDTTTESEIRAYTLADWALLTDAERTELVVMGTIAVPMSGTIPAANISYERRTESWERVAPGAVPWASMLQNGDFEWGPTASATLNSFPPWEHTTVTNGSWSLVNTGAATGSQCLVLTRSGGMSSLTGSVWQTINAPLNSATNVRLRFYVQAAQIATAGTLSIVIRFRTNAGVAVDLTEIVSLGAVDASYRLVDKILTIPTTAGTAQLGELRIEAAGLTFASAGTAVRLDNFQLFLATRGALEAHPEDSAKAPVVTNAVVLADGASGVSANVARMSVSPAGGVGGGPKVTIGRNDGDTSVASVLPTTEVVGQLQVTGANKIDLATTEGDFRIGDGTNRLKFGVGLTGPSIGTTAILADAAADTLYIGTTFGPQALTVKGSKLGINTLNPLAGLHITDYGLRGRVFLEGNNSPMISDATDMFTSGAYNGAGMWGLYKEASQLVLGVPAATADGVVFQAFNANSTFTALAQVSTLGYLSVGGTNPVTRLDVVGLNNGDLTTTEGDARVGNSTYRLKMGVYTAGGTAGDATIAAQGGTDRLYLGAGANVRTLTLQNGRAGIGIGVATPVAKLQVAGNDIVSGKANAAALIGTGSGSSLVLGSLGSAEPYIATDSGSNLRLYPEAGRVIVHISGTNTASIAQFTNGSTSTSLTDGLLVGLNSSNDAVIDMQEAANLKLRTNGSDRVIINSSGTVSVSNDLTVSGTANIAGNVGIGTASPPSTARLHVKAVSSSSVALPLLLEGSAAGDFNDIRLSSTAGGMRLVASPNALTSTPDGAAIQLFGTTSSSFGQLYLDSGSANFSAIVLRTAPSASVIQERMRVTATGEVGIGTNSVRSGAKVEIKTNATTELALTSTAAFGPARLSLISDRGLVNEWRPAYVESADSGSFTGRLDLYTNGTGAGALTGSVLAASFVNGSVGIGNSNPSNARLEVTAPSTKHGIYTTGAVGVGTSGIIGNSGYFGIYSNGGVAADGARSGLLVGEGGNGGYGGFAIGGQGGLGALHPVTRSFALNGPSGAGFRANGGPGRTGITVGPDPITGTALTGSPGGTGGAGMEAWGATGGIGGPTVGTGASPGAAGGDGGNGLIAYGGKGGNGSLGTGGGATGAGGSGGHGIFARGGDQGTGALGSPTYGAGIIALGGHPTTSPGTIPSDVGIYAKSGNNGYAGVFDERVKMSSPSSVWRALYLSHSANTAPLNIAPASGTTPPAAGLGGAQIGDFWVGSDGKLWFYTGAPVPPATTGWKLVASP